LNNIAHFDKHAGAIDALLTAAMAAHGAGRESEAQMLYLDILAVQPDHGPANHNLGLLAMHANRVTDGIEHFHKALQAEPNEAQFWLSFVKSLMVAGRLDHARQTLALGQSQGLIGGDTDALAAKLAIRASEPEECVTAVSALIASGHAPAAEKRALVLTQSHPEYSPAWTALAGALRAQGRSLEALVAFQKAVSLTENDANAHCNLGTCLLDLDRVDEAVAVLDVAVGLAPQFAEGHYFLGNCQAKLGHWLEAEASFRHAVQCNPSLVAARFNLGSSLLEQGRVDEAEAVFRELLVRAPEHPEAHFGLAKILQDRGVWQEAEYEYLQAVRFHPKYAEAYCNLSVLLLRDGRLDLAAQACERAIVLSPLLVQAHANQALVLKALGNEQGAGKAALRAKEMALLNLVTLEPKNPDVHCNLGVFYASNGRMEDAVDCYKQTIELKPNHAWANENLLFALAWRCALSPQAYLTEARKWELRVIPEAIRRAAQDRSFYLEPRLGRRLRVGYVSGDFRNHAASDFLELVFDYHDRTRIELFAYSCISVEDAVTQRLKHACDHWEVIATLDDEEAAQKILADRLDVLVDLSGHTGHNRLAVFSRRVAPVQAHYLGFLASTGLTEMDYWIADHMLIPTEHDDQYAEKVWRLPRTWVAYRVRSDMPPISLVSRESTDVCLGSFNHLSKITPETIMLWAKVMKALPGARLLLKTKALDEPSNRSRILAEFGSHGISPERIELLGGTPGWVEHMAMYDRIDIALDTVGAMGGATTTCDALAMGVPVVTLMGDRAALRMSAALLTGFGQSEWIGSDEDAYIHIVCQLARNAKLRTELRATQREKLAKSPLCDGTSMAFALEDAYEQMFDCRLKVQVTVNKQVPASYQCAIDSQT
jgi:protein O-GlcNAc transferase